MRGFIEELRHRNDFRVGIAYIVASWLIAQVADLAADAFKAPDWFMQMLIIVLLVGLPVSLFLAWAYELTPEGLMKANEVPADALKDPRSGRVLNIIIIATLAVAVLLPAAHADIHKCTDEYGNVAYLQTPCPAERDEETAVTHDADARIAEAAQGEEMTESSPEPQSREAQIPSSRQPGEPLEVCKKRYRDQIDEIDAEIRSAFSRAQGDVYKERLLALTRQLRACG